MPLLGKSCVHTLSSDQINGLHAPLSFFFLFSFRASNAATGRFLRALYVIRCIYVQPIIQADTTGDLEFAVCPRHTAKTRRHTAKTSPTVADGSHGDGKDLVRRVPNVGHTANLFAVCIYRHMAKKSEQTPSAALRRVPAPWTHGKPTGFAVCPSGRHTAKDGHFAVCCVLAHGKVCFQAGPYGYFAVCHGHGTWQSDRRNPVFFVFLGLKDHTPTYINTYITNNIQGIIYDNKHHKCNTKLLIHKFNTKYKSNANPQVR